MKERSCTSIVCYSFDDMSMGKRMVIGIDASRANVAKRTGVEWYAYHLIQELKGIIPDSYRVVLYSREPLMDGLEVLPSHWESRVLAWPPRRLWTQGRLSLEMLTRPPDLLFSPVHVLPMILPKRAIVTVHDVAFMAVPQAYAFFGSPYLRFATWFATRFARVLTVSEFSKSEIVKFFHADPARITVTPLGLDASKYSPSMGPSPKDDPYFLFVGRLEKKKNLAGLLRAFKIFKEHHENDPHRLVLVGKRGVGYDQAMMEFEACPSFPDGGPKTAPPSAEGGLGGSILRWVDELGYVAQEDILALYAGATAFVFPSWYEGFGLPILEAFASGVPVIASRTTSIPEVAGDAALYIDPAAPEKIAQAMETIVNDASLRERLITAGRARAQQFTWRATAEKTWTALLLSFRP